MFTEIWSTTSCQKTHPVGCATPAQLQSLWMSSLQNSTIFLKAKCLCDATCARNHGKCESVWQEMVGEHTRKSALHIMAAGLQWKHTACLFTQMTEIPLIPLFEALWETFTAKTFKRFQFFRLKAYNFKVFWFQSRKPIFYCSGGNTPLETL